MQHEQSSAMNETAMTAIIHSVFMCNFYLTNRNLHTYSQYTSIIFFVFTVSSTLNAIILQVYMKYIYAFKCKIL